jgi:hypothetical protein
VSSVRRHHRLLATFFNFEINRLADRFLMEIEENVNPGKETGQFSKIPFENRKNMQSHIVACDSRYLLSWTDSADLNTWHPPNL